MKRIVLSIFVALFFEIIVSAQITERFDTYVRVNSELPVLSEGLQHVYSADKKGKKTLTIEVVSLEYSDSTGMSCAYRATIQLSAIGKNFSSRLYRDDYDRIFLIHNPVSDTFELKDGETTQVVIEGRLNLTDELTYSYSIGSRFTPFVRIPRYIGDEYYAKAKALYQKQLQEEEARKQAERAKQDSIRNIAIERQNMLLTPEYLANWVGASFFTKESIESDCNVLPAAYNGGYVFYDFDKCPVTMEFDDKTHVCTEISFRLFGEDGYQMKTDLINYGYQLKSKSRGDLIAENTFQNLQTGTTSIYKVKLKNGGYSTCRITEGQAMMFTFTRTKN